MQDFSTVVLTKHLMLVRQEVRCWDCCSSISLELRLEMMMVMILNFDY